MPVSEFASVAANVLVGAMISDAPTHRLKLIGPNFLGELEALQLYAAHGGEPLTALLAGMLLIELRGDDDVRGSTAPTVVPFIRPVASGKA